MNKPESNLLGRIEWREFDVPSDVFHGSVKLNVGVVGTGGPVGVVTAGVHGDEGPWGAMAIREFLASTGIQDLAGTVRIVTAANPIAVQENRREASLDLVNLNGAFPGSASGTYTARLATVLAREVVDGSDVAIDVHGGGSWNVNCFVYEIEGSAEVAESFGAPLIAPALSTTTSLAGYARTVGAKSLWVEMGGKGFDEGRRAREVGAGISRALVRSGIVAEHANSRASAASRRSMGKTRLESSGAGIYVPVLREADLGQLLGYGVVVGTLRDPVTGALLEEYKTPYENSFVALLRPTVAVLDGPGQVVAVVHEVAE